MPVWGPVKRFDLVRCLHRAGFQGPHSGGRHSFMRKDDITVRLPNPHESDIGVELLARILRQARLTREAWERL